MVHQNTQLSHIHIAHWKKTKKPNPKLNRRKYRTNETLSKDKPKMAKMYGKGKSKYTPIHTHFCIAT